MTLFVTWQIWAKKASGLIFKTQRLLTHLIEDFVTAKAKALAIGALSCHVVDLKKEMVQMCMTVVMSNACYENVYLLGKRADCCTGTSLARPVIARAQIEIAQQEGCVAVSHGCTGKGMTKVGRIWMLNVL
jgi:argininosuccinate synthase